MNAVRINAYGGVEVLDVRELEAGHTAGKIVLIP
jgi:hypothetical protein